jgi:hypothetical protein
MVVQQREIKGHSAANDFWVMVAITPWIDYRIAAWATRLMSYTLDTSGQMDLPIYKPCLRSGYCCKKATCYAGRQHGADAVGCKFLRGDQPGNYSCGLIELHPELAGEADLAIGIGCCSPLNSDRKLV